MTENPYIGQPSEAWLERESGGDPILNELLQGKEKFMDEVGRMGHNDPYYRQRREEINDMIHEREQELGIDPIERLDTPT